MFCSLTRTILIVLICILSLIANHPSAFAQALGKPHMDARSDEAMFSFHHAMKDANERLHRLRQDQLAVALIQTSEDMNGNVLQQQFTPTSFSNNELVGTWHTISSDEKFSDSIAVSDNVLFDGANFNLGSAEVIHESQSTWTFRVENIVGLATDNDAAEQEIEKLDKSISENLLTEITIDKNLSSITSLKIYAASEFKPSWTVTIEKFELRLNYKEAWPNGPIIRHSMTRHMKGQYGWLVSIDELVTTEVSDIKKVKLN
jgi:hypothetical protein